MKTKHWTFPFSLFAVLCIVLSVLFFHLESEGNTAKVYLNGELYQTIDLRTDAEYTVKNGGNWNVLTVKDGKISVSSASCASQDCVHHAPANYGAPIVCLPNRLVIEFSQEKEMDALLR